MRSAEELTERERWLRLRQQHIGSSDAAPIQNEDPFRTATDVYWSKVVELPDVDQKQFEVGRRLEDVICEWGAHRLGVAITRNVFRVSPWADKGIMAATFDALVDGKPEAFEAKFSSQSDEWGDEGTDEIPTRVILQAQHQMHVGDLTKVYVPALIIGYTAEFRMYVVERCEPLMKEIVEANVAFWNNHVLPKVPPDPANAAPPLPYLKKLHRRPQSTIDLKENDTAVPLFDAFERARQLRKDAETKEELAQAAALALLKDNEGAFLADGRTVTYLEQNSAPRCDTTKLRMLHPKIYDAFVKQGRHRVLRIKVPK